MFKRKLTALDYPNPDNVNPNDAKEFRSIVLWLEDQKIRHYKIEERESLRKLDSEEWAKSYNKYKTDIACPITTGNPIEELQWLLSYAVRLEYSDNADKYKKQSVANIKAKNTPSVVAQNPLDNLDFNSPEFKNGVNALAKILNIATHPDHLITLKAVSKVVSKRLSPSALENPDSVIHKGTAFPFEEAISGFDLGDPVLNHAAKVLRLIYIQNLRELQTNINELIVAVQNVTADPKTDTKLGKVGK